MCCILPRLLLCLSLWLLAVSGLVALEPKPAPAPSAFRFTDVTAEAGLTKAFHGAYLHAIAWGDFEGDGRLDLFLGTFAERSGFVQYGLKQCVPNMLWRQTAPGRFEHFPSAPVEIPARCSGAVFVDLDNDGQLDLFVTSNTLPTPGAEEPKRTAQAQGCKLYRNAGGGKFVDVSAVSGACPASLVRCRDVGVFDYDGDGLLDLLVLQDKGIAPEDKVPGIVLFRNLGNLKFADETQRVVLPPDLWGAGLASADLNGDGRPDVYVCGCNRLFLSQPDKTYREAQALRALFNPPEKELDWVTGAAFGDLDNDGNLDLITGRHSYPGPSRIHVFHNDGLKDGVPQFREITKDLGLEPLPQKAPHPEIQDFDNDGILDLYWSAFFAEGNQRWPFLCKGLGVRDGLPRFAVPATAGIKPSYDQKGRIQNTVPATGVGMVYYVNSPAADYDGDGRLDLCCGNWPPEMSRLFRNDTKAGNWLQVRVQGKKMNRMGIGAKVVLYAAGKAGDRSALLGYREITVNGGYSSGRPALAHFGLGKVNSCDVEVFFPSRAEPLVQRSVAINQVLQVQEP